MRWFPSKKHVAARMEEIQLLKDLIVEMPGFKSLTATCIQI